MRSSSFNGASAASRAIETALLRLAEEAPDIRKGYKHIEGAALAAQAYKHTLGETKALAPAQPPTQTA